MPIRTRADFWRNATARPPENMNREADLSTEQACTQAPPRFSRAHGHQRRTQSGGRSALART